VSVKKIDKTTQNNVAILAAHGASTNRISKQTGLHHTSVKSILQEPAVMATREEIEKQLAALFSETAHRALNKISDDKLEKSSARDLGILAGVCVDKNRLITGQSTSNQAILLQAVYDADEGD
jgi:lambda repressor-like predicted transcriptional regulator